MSFPSPGGFWTNDDDDDDDDVKARRLETKREELIDQRESRKKTKRENKTNINDKKSAPISKHVVVLIPNSASLRGETTVMATASIATKKPPYCNRMPLTMRDDVIFF